MDGFEKLCEIGDIACCDLSQRRLEALLSVSELESFGSGLARLVAPLLPDEEWLFKLCITMLLLYLLFPIPGPEAWQAPFYIKY